MWPPRRDSVPKWLCVGLFAAASATAAKPDAKLFNWPPPICTAASPTGVGRVLLLVRRDASDPGQLTELYLDEKGRLYAGSADLELWTAARPTGTSLSAPDGPWYPLLPKLKGRYRLDSCTQTLWLAPLPQAMPKQVLNWQQPPAYRLLPRAKGAFVAADVQEVLLPHAGPQTSAVLRAGVFARAGVGDSTWLFDGSAARRLDTRLIFDDPAKRRRLVVGDTLTLSQEFTTPARFGGVQWSSDFALDPNFDPLSLPSISGEAVLPSTLELYENGIRMSSRQVGAGPFQVSNLPIVSGTGQLQIVVRNALGRSTTIRTPFYRSTQLLKPQLSAYSVEAGWLRQNFGLSEDRYTESFAAAGLRYGLDTATTVGVRTELSTGLQDVSALAAHAWPGWVLIHFTGTVATGIADGVAGTVGIEHRQGRLGFGARLRLASGGYRELGDPRPPRREFDAFAFVRPVSWLGVQVNYSEARRENYPRLRLLGAGISASMPDDWFVNLSLLRSLPGVSTVSLNLIHRFGRNGTLTLGGAQDTNRGWTASAGVQRTPQATLGTFYNAFAETGRFARRGAQIREVQPTYGLGVDLQTLGGSGALRLSGQSGLALIDGGGMFAVRAPQNGFAVVEIPGAADVEVQRDNLNVGRTDRAGRLLISNITPYAPVTLAPNLSDLPPDLPLFQVRQRVAVPTGAAIVRFTSRGRQVRRLHLVQTNGKPVPAGAGLSVDGKPANLPVGYEGLIYLDVFRAHRVGVSWRAGHCSVRVPANLAEGTHLICGSPP